MKTDLRRCAPAPSPRARLRWAAQWAASTQQVAEEGARAPHEDIVSMQLRPGPTPAPGPSLSGASHIHVKDRAAQRGGHTGTPGQPRTSGHTVLPQAAASSHPSPCLSPPPTQQAAWPKANWVTSHPQPPQGSSLPLQKPGMTRTTGPAFPTLQSSPATGKWPLSPL